VISSSQRPLPDNTQHSQQTDIHAPGGIRNHNLSRRAAADLRLRQRGHWDWQIRVSQGSLFTFIYGIVLFVNLFHDRSSYVKVWPSWGDFLHTKPRSNLRHFTFCASSNNAHSSICIVPPKRTESDFPSVWCTLAQGLRGGLSALVCYYTRIRWSDRKKLSTQILWPWFHNSDNANCNSSIHVNYTSSNRDNCKMCVKGMASDQPFAYKWIS